MTKDEAATILIEAHQGTPGVMRARRAKHRRAKLVAGDHQMIRSMVLTAHPNRETPSDEVLEAIKVLTAS